MDAQLSRIPGSLRVVIVNAFPLTAIAIGSAIRTIVPGTEPHAVRTPEEAAPRMRGAECPTLVIIDIDTHNAHGMSFLGSLRAIAPSARSVVLSGTHEPRVVEAARELGAAGYISKLASMEAIGNTLRKVLTGGNPFVKDTIPGSGYFEPRILRVTGTIQVTRKQAEVLELLCQGLPNKLIGRRLAIQPSTVKAHVSALLRAYQVRSRAELVVRAFRAA